MITDIRPGKDRRAYERAVQGEFAFFSAPMPFSGIGSLTALETALIVATCGICKPKRVFEFGTFLGHTTATLAMNTPDDCSVFSIDLFEGLDEANTTAALDLKDGNQNDEFLRRLAGERNAPWIKALDAEKAQKVRLIRGNSRELDIDKHGLRGNVDLIFVDGGHDTETITSDTALALQMASEDSIILWHDFGSTVHTDVPEYLQELGDKIHLFAVGATVLRLARLCWPSMPGVNSRTFLRKGISMYYRSPIDPQHLDELRQPNDVMAIKSLVFHASVLMLTGAGYYLALTSWNPFMILPMMFLHGTVWSFLGWAGAGHEFSHAKVFSNYKVNVAIGTALSVLSWSNRVHFRRTHLSHHQSTLKEGKDLEVEIPMSFSHRRLFWELTIDLPRMIRAIKYQLLNAQGDIRGAHADILFPKSSKKIVNELARHAQLTLLTQLGLVAVFLATGQWQLIFVVTLAPFTGTWMTNLLGASQHYGKEVNVEEYRKSTRTVLLNPILEMLYWRMNYHIEHHMYPDVPSYNLPELHRLIRADLPEPTHGFTALIREMNSVKMNSVKAGLRA